MPIGMVLYYKGLLRALTQMISAILQMEWSLAQKLAICPAEHTLHCRNQIAVLLRKHDYLRPTGRRGKLLWLPDYDMLAHTSIYTPIYINISWTQYVPIKISCSAQEIVWD